MHSHPHTTKYYVFNVLQITKYFCILRKCSIGRGIPGLQERNWANLCYFCATFIDKSRRTRRIVSSRRQNSNLHVSDLEAGINPEQKALACLAATTELPETGESNFLLIISNSNNNNKHTIGRNNLAKNVTLQL